MTLWGRSSTAASVCRQIHSFTDSPDIITGPPEGKKPPPPHLTGASGLNETEPFHHCSLWPHSAWIIGVSAFWRTVLQVTPDTLKMKESFDLVNYFSRCSSCCFSGRGKAKQSEVLKASLGSEISGFDLCFSIRLHMFSVLGSQNQAKFSPQSHKCEKLMRLWGLQTSPAVISGTKRTRRRDWSRKQVFCCCSFISHTERGLAGLAMISWPITNTGACEVGGWAGGTSPNLVMTDRHSSSWAESLLFITLRLCSYDRLQWGLGASFPLWANQLIGGDDPKGCRSQRKIPNLHPRQGRTPVFKHHNRKIQTGGTKKLHQQEFGPTGKQEVQGHIHTLITFYIFIMCSKWAAADVLRKDNEHHRVLTHNDMIIPPPPAASTLRPAARVYSWGGKY